MYELHVSARAEVARQRYADVLAEAQSRRLVRDDEQVEPRQRFGWLARARGVLSTPVARPSLDPAA